MIVRELITLLGYKVDKGSEKRAKKSFDGLKKAAQTVVAIVATGVIARGIKGALDAASSAAENADKNLRLFGGSLSEVNAEIEKNAEAQGRSRFQLEAFAGEIGAIVKPVLGSAKAAGIMATDISKLAVDMASFNDKTDENALGALRSGLIGSSEPLLAFGVNLTEASTKQDQLALGFQGAFGKLAPLQKLQVRYASILRQTVDQQDNAAQTSESYANQTKRLEGQIREITVALGRELLPAATALIKRLIAGLKFLRANDDVFRRIARAIGALVDPVVILTGAIGALGTAMLVMGRRAFIAWVSGFAPAIAIVAIIGLVGAAVLLIIDDLITMGEGGDSVIGGLISEFQLLLDETESIFDAISGVIETAVKFWTDLLLNSFGTSLRDLKKDIAGLFGTTPENLSRVIGGISKAASLANPLGVAGRAVDVSRQLAGALTNNNTAANVSVVVNAPGNAAPGELARHIGGETQKGAERALRQANNQLVTAVP